MIDDGRFSDSVVWALWDLHGLHVDTFYLPRVATTWRITPPMTRPISTVFRRVLSKTSVPDRCRISFAFDHTHVVPAVRRLRQWTFS
jgi:hypothetical protein